jgi:hypothetical protein
MMGVKTRLDMSERRKIGKEGTRFLRLVTGYKFGGHVRSMNILITLQIRVYALEEGVQDYNSRWRNHFLRMEPFETNPNS